MDISKSFLKQVLTSIVFISTFGFATTLHVATTGSDDTGDGSINSPFATIQKAVNNASNDDTVFVNSGLYVENIDWSMANNVSLIGTHMDSTIIDGGGLGKVIDNSDETAHPIEISNLTIQNGVSTGKGGGISLQMVGELSLKNMRVDNNHAEKGGGVYIEGEGSASFIPTVVQIENSVISNNSADTYGGGIALSGAIISSIIKNVTIVNNSAVDGGGGINAGSLGDYAIIANSIFWNNQPTNADGMIFPYYSNIDIPIGPNNIFTDPLFVDGDNNFNLSVGSPCIDSGIDFLVVDLSDQMLSGEIPDTLINLDSQSYNGIGPDMGAYESNHNVQQTCTADDGTDGVELWGVCYSIENTDTLLLNSSGLTGSIPPEIGNLTNLTLLLLYNNQLTGSIPSEIGNLTNLTKLVLFNNQLTDSIPSEIGNLTNLTDLALFNNQLTGSILIEIGNLTNLESLNLSGNQLTGSIPSEIGNLINLTFLRLESNQLTGEIPESICDLNIDWSGSYLGFRYFLITNNQFCPPYPSCIEEYVGEQDTTNCEQVSIIDETLPIAYNLYNAYPNPFNPVTTLQYDLPEDAMVNITIYDMMGRIVSNLVSSQQNAGYRSIQWNATNNQGQPVSAGLYLYTIQAGKFRQTKKMVLLK